MLKPILLVEDDRVFATLVESVLKELRVPNRLVHAGNGREALDYLNDNAGDRPCLILLDLYMPRMMGIEFLRLLKSNDALEHIPVVVLTASSEAADVATSFELGAAEYFKKGADYNDLVYRMSRLMPYWSAMAAPVA